MLIDAHFHPFDLEKLDPDWKEYYSRTHILGIASCHSYQEFEHAEAHSLRALSPERTPTLGPDSFFHQPYPQALSPDAAVKKELPEAALRALSPHARNRLPLLISYGIHPQAPSTEDLQIIENLAIERRIDAIGECGFDLFDEHYARSRADQAHVFMAQIGIAKRCRIPLIIHLRKAVQEVYSRSKELKQVKSLIFHAWPGSPEDAKALLKRGLNAFFSIGAQALNGRRLSIESIRRIPLERILVETDAPYQKPRYPETEGHATIKPVNHTSFCRLQDLYPIYCGLASTRGMDVEKFIHAVEQNFSMAMEKS